MKWQRYSVAIAAFLVLSCVSAGAQACNPNEDCSKCLVSVFNRCQQRGNDPVCEVRKAQCKFKLEAEKHLPVPPPAPPTAAQVQGCLADILHCPQHILPLGAQSIVDGYKRHLTAQVRGWNRLPPDFIAQVQPFYKVNLNAIQYAVGINTVHGSNITFGNQIFFTRQFSFGDENDLHLLFHELEHSVQYQNRGGEAAFIAEYVAKAAGQILRTRTFNVHDLIDFEGAAEQKANEMSATFGVAAPPPTQANTPPAYYPPVYAPPPYTHPEATPPADDPYYRPRGAYLPSPPSAEDPPGYYLPRGVPRGYYLPAPPSAEDPPGYYLPRGAPLGPSVVLPEQEEAPLPE